MDIFRHDLSDVEIQEMKDWARNHPEFNESYEVNRDIWHPIVIAEYDDMAHSRHMLRSLNTHL